MPHFLKATCAQGSPPGGQRAPVVLPRHPWVGGFWPRRSARATVLALHRRSKGCRQTRATHSPRPPPPPPGEGMPGSTATLRPARTSRQGGRSPPGRAFALRRDPRRPLHHPAIVGARGCPPPPRRSPWATPWPALPPVTPQFGVARPLVALPRPNSPPRARHHRLALSLEPYHVA